MAEMKEILIANLTLDTTRRNNIPPLIVPQGDYGARVIRAVITEQGKPVTVESAAAVSIVAERSGYGEALAFSGKVNADGSVTVPVTQWMLDVPENDVTCHVVVTGSDYQYSTTSFLIEPQKKANPTEITLDDPRKDVVTEVLAGEKERVLAEGIRRTNENTRKSAEEARQRAEEQRLTDEATRVANEAERVSSELSRDATFKGWANDIASLPSFDSRISANSDRITNLEAGLPSSVWHVDDTAARVKDVPENARPKAIVSKIGGMTYKCTVAEGEDGYFTGLRSAKVTAVKSIGANLIPYPYVDTTKTAGGVTFTLNADRSITFSGTATAGNDFALGIVPIVQGENYALSIAGSASNIHYQIRFIDANGVLITTTTIESGKLNLVVTPVQIPTEAAAMSIHLKRMANDAVSGTIYPMCNPGTTAKPYTPYVEHILPIPEELQALDGYGQGIDDTYHNFIDWRPEDGMTEWHQLCAKRPYEEGDENLENVVTDGSSETIYIIDEEIVTDISDLLPADNLISVEGGGTLTFENEYGYGIPNTVTYMLKEVTA